jgi:opacity protein-like surface antigen
MIKFALLTVLSLGPGAVLAADPVQRWGITPTFGLSQMSGQTANTVGLGAVDGPAVIDLDSGFVAGLRVEYQAAKSWGIQFGWEYRSNESSVTLSDGQQFDEGNYASNVFYLNGIYQLPKVGGLEPYVGAGLIWMQEVDIDLERNGVETSFDSQGDIGFQLLAGAKLPLSKHWAVSGELRYGRVSGIDLGSIRGLNYNPLTVQIGVTYSF